MQLVGPRGFRAVLWHQGESDANQKDPTRTLPGLQYLLNHVAPNVYFHITTTYNILRHNGVELGKQDFLGPIPQ